MKHHTVTSFSLLLLTLLSACDLGDSIAPEPQFVKVRFESGFRDVLDTFTGNLTKDLVLDGTITIPFWLTRSEQETILAAAEREQFFALPDSLWSTAFVVIDPDPSPDLLRIQVNGRDKTVVWNYAALATTLEGQRIQRLAAIIRRIIEAKPEYRRLPAARGGYI